ncbi:hypothetical protein ALI22I_30675 [Saccharothrix sp. ALI-22-I]|uniref:AAA family ATPase n=1 Tax=Saccharothrix sp. ALI-22-I TaxID=1933778 RepID=UPI00097BB12A|nr:AAA family ATPase [Saccharothrix sp. ALI-22-I]ONI84847.1 hypothetical protein ALI22I_30675 [Saccharothrix sp. ALI-22-I]
MTVTIGLVARDAELAALDDAVRALAAGGSSLFEVVGPAGAGRSAVARHVSASGATAGVVVLAMTASPDGTDPERDVLADLLSWLERPPSREPAAESANARSAPLLLVVDDAQWLDDASRARLAALARWSRDTPIMIVVTSDGLRTVLDGATVLTLRPLGATAVAELVAARFGEPADREFLDALAAHTRGRPVLLRPVLDRLAATGLGPRAEYVPDLTDRTAEVVGEVVAKALRTLPAEAVELLRVIAVCRPDFDLDLVFALARLRALTPARALELLFGAGLITSRERPELAAHIGVDRVLAGMSTAQRQELHARAAELGYRSAVAESAVARLLVGAPPSGKPWVVPLLRAAAQREREGGRSREAACHLGHALGEPVAPELKARLIVELGVAEARHAPDIGDRLLTRMLLDPELAGFTAERLDAAEQLLARGDSALARRTFGAVSATGAERDALTALYWIADDAPHEEPGLGLLEAPELPESPTDPAQAGAAAWLCAVRGVDIQGTRALARAALTGDSTTLTPRIQACRALMLTDDLDEATAGLDAAVTLARRRGLTAVAGQALVARAKVKARRGWLDEATVDLERVEVELPRRSWHPKSHAIIVALDMVLNLERGMVDRAAELSDTVPADAEAVGGFAWIHLLFSRGLLALLSDDAWSAAAKFQECGRRLLSRQWVNPAVLAWRTVAAMALRATGDTRRAERLVEEEVLLARRWGALSTLGGAHLGSALVHTGAVADRHRRAAVRALRHSSYRIRYATALLELAEASDPVRAAPLAREAAAIALANHANGLVERARRLGWTPDA